MPRVNRKAALAPAFKKALAAQQKLQREAAFLHNLGALGVPTPTPEFLFHPSRKWRLDFAWPTHKLALEVEGGVWSGGKHGRGSGIVKDMEKSNGLACLGWRLLRVTPSELPSTFTALLVRDALETPS